MNAEFKLARADDQIDEFEMKLQLVQSSREEDDRKGSKGRIITALGDLISVLIQHRGSGVANPGGNSEVEARCYILNQVTNSTFEVSVIMAN